MILVDTNILSSFAKIDRLELLFMVFRQKTLCISPNVFQELKDAKDKRYDFVEPIFDLLQYHKLKLLPMEEDEYLLMLQLPKYLGKGELDSIAICTRRNYSLLSNERKVIKFCEENGIDHFDLNGILNALWMFDIVSKEEVVLIIKEMEEKDNLKIVSKDEIFKNGRKKEK
jgi:predicted nucleic acid-binding protein